MVFGDQCKNLSILAFAVACQASVTAAPAAGPEWFENCTETAIVHLEERLSSYQGKVEIDQLFIIQTPTAGVLVVEIEKIDANDNPANINFLGLQCGNLGHAGGREAALIEQSAGRRVIAVSSAGPLLFSIADPNPRRAFETMELTASFTAATAIEAVHRFGAAVIRQTDFYRPYPMKNEPEEVDPAPDNFGGGEPLLTLLTARAAIPGKNEPEEVDPDPDNRSWGPTPTAQLVLFPSRFISLPNKNEPEEVDPDPDNFGGLPSRAFDGLLTAGETAIGRSVPANRGWVSLRLAGASDAPLFEWLARVLETEMARSHLISPGAGGLALRLVEYQPDPFTR